MGGSGSGRQSHYNAKSTVDNYCSIDIRKWYREGLLHPGTSFSRKWLCGDQTVGSIQVLTSENRLVLSYRYRHSADWIDTNYPIKIVWTNCNFGGKRPWLLCPVEHCGKRVAILYGGAIFACRKCYQLAYQCQRENAHHRVIRKAEKMRKRMGWEPGIMNSEGVKPKGMHWKTYLKLCKKHDQLVDVSLTEVGKRLGINLTASNALKII